MIFILYVSGDDNFNVPIYFSRIYVDNYYGFCISNQRKNVFITYRLNLISSIFLFLTKTRRIKCRQIHNK